MRIIPASDIAQVLTFPDLIETLRRGFRSGAVTPVRHHHTIELPDQADATLLLMPSWNDFAGQGHSDRGYVGVKVATVFPGNAAHGRPAVAGVYLLFSGRRGEPLAVIDGSALTLWRTAAASALAASYLARSDASRMLMVGSGALAPYLIEAHAAIRPISDVLVWNRRHDKAVRLAQRLKGRRYSAAATEDLEGAVRGADIVSCATLSGEPLIHGEWLKPGAHLDLVGGFRPDMREADDEAMRRSRIFVDTREGATQEAGDIVQPLQSGLIAEEDIAADLFDLTRGERAGRRFYDQITLFKSVGTALEDLAAAILVFSRA
ncbi:ornithine cyclodeaminase family protein [Afifella sp. IM 167]|uniref:ornithine cyclodeaminase family protein n=1 Tax=Afifella sp. IM 167 TaxID=2033586 RepID=UPI001CCDF68E|nr:ornithine cyclodeaminase family protein [Afifella sp. IM 167]MBZ8133583.1 ornithine cyclodeaminase [Afifella sp. IM 167]